MLLAAVVLLPASARGLLAASPTAVAEFRKDIQPLLQEHCYGCHGNGSKKGQVAFDKLESDASIVDPILWFKVLKNVRAGLMPPPGEPRPSSQELAKIENWIKFSAFGLDPKNPDPGRVTVRRLNRTEYRNSLRDLLGVDFDVDVALPPDDIGYGFDNIGDVLSISPIRMEKFIEAAISAVEKSVPMDTVAISSQMALPADFLTADGAQTGDRLSFYEKRAVSKRYHAKVAGEYRIHIAGKVDGQAQPDPQRVRLGVYSDDKLFFQQDYKWSDAEYFDDERIVYWEPGDHYVSFVTEPLLDLQPGRSRMDYRILYVRLEGPLDRKHWEHPPGYNRFYTREAPPQDPAERRAYAREVLGKFVPRAFRRPVSEETLEQLLTLAENNYSLPGVPFEKGIAQAIVAVLASPRFLFHLETAEPLAAGQTYARIDEYTLASRLSFALWCSIPDDELIRLAGAGELRKNFHAQVKRMLSDPKSQAFVESFSGQWLQSRGVLDIPINSAEVMAREGVAIPAPPAAAQNADPAPAAANDPTGQSAAPAAQPAAETPAATPAAEPARGRGDRGNAAAGNRGRGGRGRGPQIPPGTVLTPEIRAAMKQEVEAYFAYVMRNDRSVLDLLQSDYTFVNEVLAPVYGIANIRGPEMRQVKLGPTDPRGGVLTMGAVLTVTSNPTRTSPVKRGKWILENILGSPPAPPPPNIPALEDTKSKIADRKPTQRELLALHREDALCASCHARMDPLGLAMENFNAFGRSRTVEDGNPIDPAGELATGEKFANARDLKQVLVEKHRAEFYRTLTEKLLTYTLGRGAEYYDVATIDSIVEQLEKQDGRFSSLLLGVLESTPFQMRRTTAHAATGGAPINQENVSR